MQVKLLQNRITSYNVCYTKLLRDGGILSFGANCFNMAFVLPFAGYLIYKLIKDNIKSEKGEYLGIAFGSYMGINLAALLAAIA